MPGPKGYNPKDFSIVVGTHIVTGYADGTFIEVDRDEDAFTKVTGADGETTRVASANRAGTITITLAQSSASNDALSLIAAADELQGAGVVPVIIRDNTGRTTAVSAFAWVKKLPTGAFSKEVETREWVMDCTELAYFVGGNNNLI